MQSPLQTGKSGQCSPKDAVISFIKGAVSTPRDFCRYWLAGKGRTNSPFPGLAAAKISSACSCAKKTPGVFMSKPPKATTSRTESTNARQSSRTLISVATGIQLSGTTRSTTSRQATRSDPAEASLPPDPPVSTAEPFAPQPTPKILEAALPDTINRTDPALLSPTGNASLYFADPNDSSAIVEVKANFGLPTVLVDHSTLVTNVTCDGNGINIVFTDQASYEKAQEEWSKSLPLLLIGTMDNCSTVPASNATSNVLPRDIDRSAATVPSGRSAPKQIGSLQQQSMARVTSVNQLVQPPDPEPTKKVAAGKRALPPLPAQNAYVMKAQMDGAAKAAAAVISSGSLPGSPATVVKDLRSVRYGVFMPRGIPIKFNFNFTNLSTTPAVNSPWGKQPIYLEGGYNLPVSPLDYFERLLNTSDALALNGEILPPRPRDWWNEVYCVDCAASGDLMLTGGIELSASGTIQNTLQLTGQMNWTIGLGFNDFYPKDASFHGTLMDLYLGGFTIPSIGSISPAIQMDLAAVQSNVDVGQYLIQSSSVLNFDRMLLSDSKGSVSSSVNISTNAKYNAYGNFGTQSNKQLFSLSLKVGCEILPMKFRKTLAVQHTSAYSGKASNKYMNPPTPCEGTGYVQNTLNDALTLQYFDITAFELRSQKRELPGICYNGSHATNSSSNTSTRSTSLLQSLSGTSMISSATLDRSSETLVLLSTTSGLKSATLSTTPPVTTSITTTTSSISSIVTVALTATRDTLTPSPSSVAATTIATPSAATVTVTSLSTTTSVSTATSITTSTVTAVSISTSTTETTVFVTITPSFSSSTTTTALTTTTTATPTPSCLPSPNMKTSDGQLWKISSTDDYTNGVGNPSAAGSLDECVARCVVYGSDCRAAVWVQSGQAEQFCYLKANSAQTAPFPSSLTAYSAVRASGRAC
ncbi:Hypothetical protein D9617_15g043570 [Elsinoe fawcettii]|nr:Hypothetical protein D9617_15g043570 [Elsinoe fawcettii]